MKIDRLIGIITVLLQNEKVTAPWLAEKFEVSRRTINRDIEDICRAGIPVVTTQGYEGGISIAEGYKLDKNVFTTEELKAIFIGLKSMDSVSNVSYTKRLADKLTGAGGACTLADSILIDLSTHYKNSLAPKIELLQEAISRQRCTEFRYYYNKGESERTLEPYLLIFRWASWYVLGFCRVRGEFRMFKLNRISELRMTEEEFDRRELPAEAMDFEKACAGQTRMLVRFDAAVKYRLVEDYGTESFSEQEDGSLLFSFPYLNEDEIARWLLSFGGSMEVLEPKALRERVVRDAEAILRQNALHRA